MIKDLFLLYCCAFFIVRLIVIKSCLTIPEEGVTMKNIKRVIPALVLSLLINTFQPLQSEMIMEEYVIEVRTRNESIPPAEQDQPAAESNRMYKDSIAKPWYKSGAFWFGLWNGYWLPWTYGLTLGLDLFDIPMAAKEKFETFSNGAAIGIGVRMLQAIVAYTIGAAAYCGTQQALAQRTAASPA